MTSVLAPPSARSSRPIKLNITRAFLWLLIIAVGSLAAFAGIKLRIWTFDAFDPIRFRDDLRRGVFWGLHASGPEGFLNQYSKMDPEIPEWQNSRWTPWLDYGPLRLLVMRQWGAWQRKNFPP
jgi:hypothetical protein